MGFRPLYPRLSLKKNKKLMIYMARTEQVSCVHIYIGEEKSQVQRSRRYFWSSAHIPLVLLFVCDVIHTCFLFKCYCYVFLSEFSGVFSPIFLLVVKKFKTKASLQRQTFGNRREFRAARSDVWTVNCR